MNDTTHSNNMNGAQQSGWNGQDRRNGNGSEYRTIKILQSEAARYVAILVFVVPIIFYMAQIKTDIALIKQNHLTHIEAIEKELKDQKDELIDLHKQDIEQQKEIVELQKQSLILLERISRQPQ